MNDNELIGKKLPVIVGLLSVAVPDDADRIKKFYEPLRVRVQKIRDKNITRIEVDCLDDRTLPERWFMSWFPEGSSDDVIKQSADNLRTVIL